MTFIAPSLPGSASRVAGNRSDHHRHGRFAYRSQEFAGSLKAVEIARLQQAKSLGLRAGMSLNRLWQKQGKKKKARHMLEEIYGWFTEGLGTKDLQEAKALLDELS